MTVILTLFALVFLALIFGGFTIGVIEAMNGWSFLALMVLVGLHQYRRHTYLRRHLNKTRRTR